MAARSSEIRRPPRRGVAANALDNRALRPMDIRDADMLRSADGAGALVNLVPSWGGEGVVGVGVDMRTIGVENCRGWRTNTADAAVFRLGLVSLARILCAGFQERH